MSQWTREKVREKWESRRSDDHRREARKSATPFWWLMEFPWFWLTLTALTLASAPVVAGLPESMQRWLVIAGWSKALPVWAIVFIVPMLAVPRLQISRNYAAMQKWLASLPFEVEFYEDALGEYARYGSLELQLHFKGDAPRASQLQALLEEDGASWKVSVSGASVHLRREPGLGEQKTATNRKLWKWFPHFVTNRVLEMHAQVPMERLTFLP
jgi:hypothetical protein